MRSACLLLALLACASTPARPPEAGRARTLTIVGINDVHGALLPVPAPKWAGGSGEIGGADWFAGYLNAIRADADARGDAVVVLDGGDEFQGTLISNEFQGRSVTDVFNAMGVTAGAVGNHEFDFGIGVLKERMAQAKYPILAANVFLKGTRERPEWARPSALIEEKGIRIGIVGLATRETATVTNPVNVTELDFADGGAIAAQEADALRARGATVVLLTAHAGPLPPDREIVHVAEAVRGKIDAIVSGHNHTVIGPPPLIVAGIPIVQSGAKLQRFSTIELSLDAQNHVRSFTVNEGALPVSGAPQAILHGWNGQPAKWRGRQVAPDAHVAAILEGYDVQVKKLRDMTIGETRVELRKGGPDDLLANLTTDALRSGAGGGLRAQFSFQNAGGLRINEIPAGPITFGQIFDLYPFDNEQVVVSIPAPTIRDAMEAVLRAGKGALRVSGMRYVIDWDRFGAGSDPQRAPAGAIVTRVVADDGKVLAETKSCARTACESTFAPGTYTVSVTDFMTNGGDGLSMLKDAPRQIGGVLARDVIVAWVKQQRPITAQLLGSPAAGGERRWTQVGNPPAVKGGE